MKRLLVISFLLPLFVSHAQSERSYVGVELCVKCHKSEKQGLQKSIWEDSRHAQAYFTLQTEEADRIALERGYETKAVETDDCLICHAVGYNLDASLLGKKFKVEDGVQCEVCHGPGSDYKSKKIMKDREASVANGLVVHENIEDFCTNCHNADSPTYVEFVLEEMWEKIKHPVPEKKN